jgi:dihydroneopterin aldolase/2-amino-4-hydroxy-6-hydroxymethyldihydropteridine diphosphokinase/dihydropteroate synthase
MSTKGADEPPMYKLLPFPSSPSGDTASTWTCWKYPLAERPSSSPRKTHLMATLNTTPDSFSDGSDHVDIPSALAYVQESVAAGAHIVDIGGYSTRPGAAFVSSEEEINRVIPIIKAIRSLPWPSGVRNAARDVLISVDTFRPDVARAAVLAGANCINDVYGFAGPQYPLDETSARHFLEFKKVARELVVPVILMHSRGDAGTNKDYSAYSHAADGSGAVVEGVKIELGERVEAAIKGPGGLRRWLVIADPGVGFSKTLEGNLQVLRNASKITSDPTLSPSPHSALPCPNALYGFPLLIGASRKSFLGAILGNPDPTSAYDGRDTAPKEREWATAAVVACAVQQGALVVRVHGVHEMGDVVRIANALWV